MKLVSWWLTNKETRKNKLIPFLTSPYLSVRSLYYHPRTGRPLLSFFIYSTLLISTIMLAKRYLGNLSGVETMLFSPVIYFLTESAGALGQTLFYFRKTFPIHRFPLKARTLSNFWGRDWNLWVQDWLRDVSTSVRPGNKNKKIIIVFLTSGLFHEIMCNLPYWLYYRKSYFGTMIAYFTIQAIALWIDKKFICHAPSFVRRAYLWIAVVVPSPLFINVPLLRFFGLAHE